MDMSARRVVNVGSLPAAPYSHAVSAGGLIYLSGVLADDDHRQAVAPGDVGAQTRMVIERLQARLEAAGSSLEQVVAVTVYLASASDFAAMNAAYAAWWGGAPPTRTTVMADLVVEGALVEMSMVAVPNGAERAIVHPADWQPATTHTAMRSGPATRCSCRGWCRATGATTPQSRVTSRCRRASCSTMPERCCRRRG